MRIDPRYRQRLMQPINRDKIPFVYVEVLQERESERSLKHREQRRYKQPRVTAILPTRLKYHRAR